MSSMEVNFEKELKKLGQRIKQLRKHRKLTLLDLELLSGVADTKISRYERGHENVEYLTLFKLAKGLQVEINALTDYGGPLPENKSIIRGTNTKSGRKK
jgi:HTH-type transcriptional regulator, competence development regulator